MFFVAQVEPRVAQVLYMSQSLRKEIVILSYTLGVSGYEVMKFTSNFNRFGWRLRK